MIVWGGFINDGITPTGGRYDPATDTWMPTNLGGSPPTRMWPIGEWTGTEMIVWGGYNWLYYFDYGDGARYNPVTDTWVPTSSSGAPSPRVAQSVWTGRDLVLWGGANDSSGGRYVPATDTWRPTTLVSAPEVLWGGRWSTVWTGNQMIVWGGEGPTQQGSLYCASGRANIAPGATGDTYSAVAGQTLVVGNANGVLDNDTGNGDPLVAVLATGPLHGVLQLNANGSFTYVPNTGFVGRDAFSYRAFDGLATSNLAQVHVMVE
jgi:hypothetical protein